MKTMMAEKIMLLMVVGSQGPELEPLFWGIDGMLGDVFGEAIAVDGLIIE